MKKEIRKPNPDDSGFFRNGTNPVNVIVTDKEPYPCCRLKWLIPDTSSVRMDMNGMIFQKKEYYSVRVPGKFTSSYSEGFVSDLVEQEYLRLFQKENHLEDAVVVINYTLHRTRGGVSGCMIPISYVNCYVELLADTEPSAELDFVKVVYYIFEFPDEYMLEEGSMEKLHEESRYRLLKFICRHDKRSMKLMETINRLEEEKKWKNRIRRFWKNFRKKLLF